MRSWFSISVAGSICWIALILLLNHHAFAQPVRFMNWWSGAQGEALAKVIDALESAQDEIRFENHLVPGLGGAYEEQAAVMVAAGAPPDLMAFTDDNLRGLVESGNALTIDLTPFIEREDPEFIARIPPQLLEPLRGRDGRIYALPFFFIMWFHTYNKDLFEEAGVPFPEPGSWTWEKAYLEAGRLLTRDRNGDGVIDQWFTGEVSTHRYSWRQFIWQNGGEVLDPTGTRSLFNSEKTREAVQFMADLIHVHQVQAPPGTPSGSFVGGTRAVDSRMVLGFDELKQVAEFAWDIVHLPYKERIAQGFVVNAIGIPVNAPDPERSWQALKLMVSELGQTIVGRYHMGMPIYPHIAREVTLADPDLPITRPEVTYDVSVARSAIVPHNGRLAELNNNIVAPWINNVLRGTVDANRAVEEIHRLITILLDK